MTLSKKILTYVPLFLSTILCLIVCSNGYSGNSDDEIIFREDVKLENHKHYKAVPNDLVLIYDGGIHRNIKWDKNHFSPYVSTLKSEKHTLLFDGFLFLEIKDGKGRGFASGYEKLAARKTEWTALLENYFSEGNAIHALNAQLEDVFLSGKIADELDKRKVVLALPEPIPNQTDWGELDGISLNFSNKKDRLKACKWYIDYAEQLFKKANFNYVELVGFYWLAEEATNSRDLAKDVAAFIYKKDYDFYWIPYFNSDGYQEWKSLGFNQVYYQPNYFFNEKVPFTQLQEACERARNNQMNMEVEFDERVLKNSKDWGQRLNDYLDVFEKNGVFDSLKVAYYQGGDAFYRLSQSKYSEDVQLYNRLIDIIISRQKVKK